MFIQSQHVFRTCSVCAIYQPNQRRFKLSTPDQPLNNAHLQPHARQPFLIAINTPTFLRLARARERESERARACNGEKKNPCGKTASVRTGRRTSGKSETHVRLCSNRFMCYVLWSVWLVSERDLDRGGCISRVLLLPSDCRAGLGKNIFPEICKHHTVTLSIIRCGFNHQACVCVCVCLELWFAWGLWPF